MERLILRIYDFLSGKKWLALVILAVAMILCAFLASRLTFKEDISAFLPNDRQSARTYNLFKKIGADSKVAVFFEGDDSLSTMEISQAMEDFATCWNETDSLGVIDGGISATLDDSAYSEVFDFISANYPYFLQESDYARMDSLLSVPGYVDSRMEDLKSSLYSIGNPFQTAFFRSDPLALFTPVLKRLSTLNPAGNNKVEGGCLFADDGRTGVIFFDSPFGGSDSSLNSRIKSMIEGVSGTVMKDNPGIRIFATGGPLVAVENAIRIKKDSILGASLALVLILLLLYFSYKRLSDMLWILVTIACGALFSLGIISIFKSGVSLIVLGIGSMMIGIAVNYPLHYIDHLKYQPDKRKALRDQVNPLLVGNITTVGAFLSLMFMKSEALGDFGFIGAAMLVGTIIFVLIFLPVFIKPSASERNTIKLDWDRNFKVSPRVRNIGFVVFLILTSVLYYFSTKVGFDSDLHNINYMTEGQKRGFEILSGMSGNGSDTKTLFLSATADDENSAAEASSRIVSEARNLLAGTECTVSSLNDFVPAPSVQSRRLEMWQSFCTQHPDLRSRLLDAGSKCGFNERAFAPFLNMLETDFQPEDLSYFSPLANAMQGSIIADADGTTIVNRIKVPAKDEASVCKAISETLPEGCMCFSEGYISSSLTGTLSSEFDQIGFVCSLIVFIFLCLSFRSLELSIISFLPLAIAWIWILGMMQILGIRFNIVNIILATFIFGQGDDYTIFITEGLITEYASGRKILRSYKNCVTLSAIIMFIGMGALIIARHPAMKSLAYVTIIGMFTVVVMAYYLPPLVFKWITMKKGRPRLRPVTIVKLLRTVISLLVYVLAMIIITPLVLVFFAVTPSTEKRNFLYHKLIRDIAYPTIRLIPGVRFTQSNPYGEDFSKPALIVCNHQSQLDILALLQLSPRIIALTNDWVWNNPLYSILIHKAEFYPVSDGMDTNLPKLRSLVDRGYSIVVFPEGTRSYDCNIQRFHQGAFYLAKELGIDLLPLYIHGFGHVNPKGDLLLNGGSLSLEVGQRISCSEIQDDLKAYARSFRKLYMEKFEDIRRQRETSSYLAPIVLDQYRYKGTDVVSACRSIMKPAVYSEIDSLVPENGKLEIHDCGYGAYALLAALVHRDAEVYAYDCDKEKLLVAERCAAVPANLHYLKEEL